MDGNTNVMRNIENGNIVDRLVQQAQRHPDKVAYGMLDAQGFPNRTVSFASLLSHVELFSAVLHEKGIRGGQRCMLMFQEPVTFIVALLACQRVGAIAVPVHTPGRRKSLLRWEGVARDAKVQCVLTDDHNVQTIESVFSTSSIMSKLPIYDVQVPMELQRRPQDVYVPSPEYGDIAHLQYTSGSTATPKGVIVTHASLIDNLQHTKEALAFDHDSVMVTWLPYYHDMGLVLGLLQGIYSGCSVYVMKPLDFMQRPLNWIQALSVCKATHTGAPNFALELAAEKLEHWQEEMGAPPSLHTLKRVICGAEPIRLRTLLRFAHASARYGFDIRAITPGYGLAEATLVVSIRQLDDSVGCLKLDRAALQQGQVSVRGRMALHGAMDDETDDAETWLVGNGRILESHELSIRDPESFRELGTLEIGEICVSGPSVTEGYWNRQQETQQTFPTQGKGHPILRTGDLGFVDTNGELYVTGRMKDLMILRGMNLYPQGY